MSVVGPGCVKTSVSQRCTELFSQFSSRDRSCQCNCFSHRRNRDGNSTRKLNVRVFTQPRSKSAVLTAGLSLPVFPCRAYSVPVGMSQTCQKLTHAPRQTASSFDHLVGAGELTGYRFVGAKPTVRPGNPATSE